MAYTDKTLTCVECKNEFVFTARDQEFHASKGFTNEPKRCPSCRQARRVARGESAPPSAASRPAASYSGPRARGGTGGTRPQGGMNRNGGRPRRRDNDERGDAVSARSFGDGNEPNGAYTGVCAACGNETAIPANGEARMILCEACYGKMAALTRS